MDDCFFFVLSHKFHFHPASDWELHHLLASVIVGSIAFPLVLVQCCMFISFELCGASNRNLLFGSHCTPSTSL
jgi:hypothetical protein